MLEEVLIPRIQIKRQDEQFIEWNQHGFPVMSAIAKKTFVDNKSHGQTLKKWDSC